ncbi:zinc finger protein basonuclin-2 isoform X1 [Coccinella septempunctata]|uniref:zinc finger protein basonuclin-2 isoform X1 n=2 Tax=Coccinella septempunctata TaxID=41139 RepID=UPI001D097596|nr:zinc finger protein basonuclin-2 isoform X1 [Coccinella septempunctata]
MNSSNFFGGFMNWSSVASWFTEPETSCLQTAMEDSERYINGVSDTAPVDSVKGSSQSDAKTNGERILPTPKIATAIKCTVPNCSCDCFIPGTKQLRYCETCKHGWVPHALDKLGVRHLFSNSAPEPVQPNAAFDIASLVLYGCSALPIRLKILLDRLFSVLHKDQVVQVLHGFGWTPIDYARGYILQETHGSTLDRWTICSPEEEPLVLQQFLRFGETRAITQQLLLAQQALQESNLERLEKRHSPNHRRVMSPNRRHSPPVLPPSAFHLSRMPTMSPHQKYPLPFLKMPSSNGPLPSLSPPRSINNSPMNTSPLNRLQNMQPFDFRKLGAGLANFSNRVSPDLNRRRTNESENMGLNLTMSTSLPTCLPPPPPPTSTLSHVAMAAAVNPLAASLVASSFPSLMSARLSTGSKSPSNSDLISGNTNSEEDDDKDENSHSALNLSRDRDSSKDGQLSSRVVPGRKLSTPTKRQWTSPSLPLNLGTQFINPATGKKRVQCNVCLKTFCDKGALKIHFSAVHLREMHKCTVEGCNMMFSSRRSRNRHSANPNPKLHSPHLRRKISPHDGRSAQSHPILIPPQTSLGLPAAAALNPLNPFGPFPLINPTGDLRHHSALAMEFKQSLDLSMQRMEEQKNLLNECDPLPLTASNSDRQQHMEEDDEDDDGIVVVGGVDEDDREKNEASNSEISDQPEDFSIPSKRPKTSVSDVDEEMTDNVDSNDDSISVTDNVSVKDEAQVQTSKRKRKSQNPTRCAVPIMMEDTASDGDSTSDVFSDRISSKTKLSNDVEKSENEMAVTEQGKNEEEERLSPLNLEKRSADENANEPEKSVANEIKTSIAPLYSIDKTRREKPVTEAEQTDYNYDGERERPASSVESNKSDESFDSSNALRHLESLSHGHFGDFMSRSLHMGLTGQGSQFPPLGFMMGGGPPSPARSQTSSAGSSNGNESADENSQNQFFGHFDNGQFISTMDVPIDKENPRRCTACGKIFQNHFGVKTHYQNVHLKLMHKCNVDGCNAAFPSKRSRDRHSANLNLHRKLLSTTSDNPASSLLEKSPFASISGNPALHGDFLSRLYAEEALKNHHLAPPTLDQLMLNGDRIPPSPLLLPPLGGLPFHLGNFSHFPPFNGNLSKKERSSSPSSPLSGSPPPNSSPSKYVHCVEEDLPTADKDGKLPCRICRMTFSTTAQLKDHCEKNHLSDMFKCTVANCPKVFMSRTRRNIHSENESFHTNSSRKIIEPS